MKTVIAVLAFSSALVIIATVAICLVGAFFRWAFKKEQK